MSREERLPTGAMPMPPVAFKGHISRLHFLAAFAAIESTHSGPEVYFSWCFLCFHLAIGLGGKRSVGTGDIAKWETLLNCQ